VILGQKERKSREERGYLVFLIENWRIEREPS